MNSLPSPIVDVTVPECFSPSALGPPGGCLLKLICASLRRRDWGERLAPGPEAAVGALLHRVLERAARENGSAEDIFEEEYRRIVTELRSDPRRAHFADLASTKSLAEWTRQRAWVLSRARALRGSRSRGDWTPHADAILPVAGVEVPLESRSLRLRGKADRIRQLGARVFEVRDFKTGATLDGEGAIKPEIALQLQAYGLMLLERRQGIEVSLVVDDGVDRTIPFDDDGRQVAKNTIEEIMGSMPPAGLAAAAGLARPGSDCWGCAIRHVCLTYRSTAPNWWMSYPSTVDRLSNDVWGTVVDIVGSGCIDVVLRDDAGRRVRIDGVDERHGISASSIGSRLWFFGLEASGVSRGFDGVRFYPRSFHELPRDRQERRAWALHVFVGQECGSSYAPHQLADDALLPNAGQ